MYYFLGYRLITQPMNALRKQKIADHTFLLALDGDVDFKPAALQLLVDRMKKSDKVAAACGRIHPKGSGKKDMALLSIYNLLATRKLLFEFWSSQD